VRDLAENGLRVEAVLAPPLLARVAVCFELPGHGSVTAIGLVMWRAEGRPGRQAPHAFGLLFEAIALGTRIAIARFVDANDVSAREGQMHGLNPAR
jgi:hypothetical protein